MRKTICLISVLALGFAYSAWAEEEAGPAKVDINGEIEVNQLVGIADDPQYLNYKNLNVFTLKAKSTFESRLNAYGEIRFRNIGYSDVNTLESLGERNEVEPNELEIAEAYLECKGFILSNLDLEVGKQRIAWGTADTINPTDNLNPMDLEDPIDFKKRLGTDSMMLTYYLDPLKITGVYAPRFVPSLFPSELLLAQARGRVMAALPQGVQLRNLSDEVDLPEYNPKNSAYAVKVGWNVFNYDMSVSYYNGRDTLPVVTRTVFAPASLTTWDSSLTLVYPREQVIGYDFSGSIGQFGVWGEAAAFIPEKIENQVYMGSNLYTTSTSLDNTPYYKWVVGTDYTLDGGWYFNLQLLHGFTVERATDLRNYITLQAEKKFMDETLRVTLKAGADVTDVKDHQLGYMPNLEIGYKPIDNTEVILGAMILDGKDNTTLGEFRDLDEAYLKFKYSF